MASDYGRNFGFRRSDESYRTSEGRFKTPVGSALRLGTAVEIDAATPGYLKQCAANAAPVTGTHGLLVQEEFVRGTYDVASWDSYDLGVARPDALSVITAGPGTKVWFQNTGSETRLDGRSISSVTMATLTGVAVGDFLGWDGSKWVESDGDPIPNWMVVTAVSVSDGYVEAAIQF